jgi:hypothetical protein
MQNTGRRSTRRHARTALSHSRKSFFTDAPAVTAIGTSPLSGKTTSGLQRPHRRFTISNTSPGGPFSNQIVCGLSSAPVNFVTLTIVP